MEFGDGTFTKYDSEGNKIEMGYIDQEDGGRMRDFYKYDLGGKLVESRLYRNESSLVFSFRYTYELDHYGNWTKQLKTTSSVDDPCDPTLPPEVVYREITYYPG